MYKLRLNKFFMFVCIQALFLASCDAIDPLVDPLAEPLAGAALDGTAKELGDDTPTRLISLYLEQQSSYSGTPVFDDRIVVAQPVYTIPVNAARANGLVDEVNVVFVGNSCQELQAKYLDLTDCVEEETAEFRYGEVESTVHTDSEGFALMNLGGAEKYRLRVQSFVTEEDPKCYWGGEATVDAASSEVSIPLLVFCE